jgi:uncharacterized protein (TIGR00255 family)
MTGFTRVAGQHESVGWIWEIRSVNGKGLDLRVRLPYGYEALEAIVRDAAGKILKRGSVSVSLTVNRAGAESAYRVNRELLDRLLALSGELKDEKRLSNEPARLDTLLTVRGVVDARNQWRRPCARRWRRFSVCARRRARGWRRSCANA